MRWADVGSLELALISGDLIEGIQTWLESNELIVREKEKKWVNNTKVVSLVSNFVRFD